MHVFCMLIVDMRIFSSGGRRSTSGPSIDAIVRHTLNMDLFAKNCIFHYWLLHIAQTQQIHYTNICYRIQNTFKHTNTITPITQYTRAVEIQSHQIANSSNISAKNACFYTQKKNMAVSVADISLLNIAYRFCPKTSAFERHSFTLRTLSNA